MLAGLERRERELLVAVAAAPRDDVDHIDVAAPDDLLGVGHRLGDRELPGGGLREVLMQVADHDDVTERRPREAGEMRAGRPPSGPDDADPELLLDHRSSGRSTQRRSRCDSATALITSCTPALCAKLP